jgi:hypothetical protein
MVINRADRDWCRGDAKLLQATNEAPMRLPTVSLLLLFVLAWSTQSPVASEPKPGEANAPVNSSQPDWWSLEPIGPVHIPRTAAIGAGVNSEWPRTPVDAFVLAKLHEQGLAPSAEADRGTLIRRVFFDLVGLPPSPDDVREFLADPAPDAYERLVDRLLASPRYGERWARHWMDVVHFAETHGHDQDRIREHAWRYRDYLIEAFNTDKPYGRFIEEQIAADVLFPDEPRLAPALGFIAAGPWDESSLRDIREDTIDRQIGHYLDRDDMVTTTMATFTSLTVHCARCHDHKFDPITQRDYYGLQAVFAGVGRANRAFDPDRTVQSRRQALKRELKDLEARAPAFMARLREPDVQSEIAAREKRIAADAVVWRVLDPTDFTTAKGSTLTRESDGVLFAGGERPEKDTYTVRARSDLANITAVRLEVLDDDRMPKRGPGRQDNGNLHLSEFRIEAVAPADGDKPPTATPLAVALASADFDQTGWTIQHAIDGNVATAWGIFPEVGKPHEAVLELKEPLAVGKAELRFTLEQQHGGGHLIGKLRLSVTDHARPVRVSRLPDAIAAIIQTPRDARSAEQTDQLAAYFWRDKVDRELAALPPPQFVFAAASDFAADGSHKPPPGPRPVHILNRGDINTPGDLAVPAAIEALSAQLRFDLADSANEGARRAALARWISDPRNPLTRRSIVNRLWHYHFGRGIVDTPNDFGRMGSLPSHPEMLDWLAAEFEQSGGSLKKLHRLIVTSATYRQRSSADRGSRETESTSGNSNSAGVNPQSIDADNRLLWRMNHTRLDAESVRDAILQISGRLDFTVGGPSDRQFSLRPGIHVTPLVNYSEFDWSGPGSNRRSVYRFIFRTLPDPFMDCLDCADASQLTGRRNVSVTPLQALVMLNNEFVLTHSEHLARQLESHSDNLGDRVERACELAFARSPTAGERRELAEFAAKHGLAALGRLLFNSNEFMFVN